MKKAKESEQKYEWLQATKLYKKATDLALKENVIDENLLTMISQIVVDHKNMRHGIEIIRKRLMNFIFDEEQFKDKVESLIDQISKKEIDPHSAAEEILSKILK